MTEFSKFIQGINFIYGIKRDAGSIVESFFDDTLIDSTEKKYLIENYSSQFRQYYNGTRNISKIAKSLLNKTDFEKVKVLLYDIEDSQAQLIVNHFKSFFADITLFNYGDKIAELYQQILVNANNPSTALPLPRNIDYEIETDSEIAELTHQKGPKLFLEANGICPWCCSPLIIDSTNNSSFNYKVFKISSNSPINYDHLIALCNKCFKKFYLGESKENLEKLCNLKKDMLKEYNSRITLNEEKIEHEIRNLLASIIDVELETLVPLKMIPTTIKNKLGDCYRLYMKVQSYAVDYYQYVADTLKDLHSEGKINSELFQHKVKTCFLKLKGSHSKEQIFAALVQWLIDQTRKDRYACEIVISYFVQHCEVYDEISE